MKRKIYDKLLEWKNTTNNKPLMVLGARQVGKTYIIKEFCKENFENFIEINLFKRKDIVDMYKSMRNSDDKYKILKTLINFDLENENTVLFIDEIQESEELISELKYFCEEHNNLKIICAGSLLGVKLKRSHFSFPVGKVWMINMYPMDFEEFLISFDENLLLEEIKNHYKTNTPMVDALHQKALDYYRLYLVTGGMPESVKYMVNINKDIIKYDSNILNTIIESYFNDMNKYVENNTESLRIREMYKSIPSQLANKSNKFQYSKIENNARKREYENVLNWLISSNMILQAFCLSKPGIPPKLYEQEDIFKLYINDVGILNNLLEIKYADILMDNLSENKGIISENYVATSLVTKGYKLYYWSSDYEAEVDFVIYTDDGLIPIEVKYGDNTQSKSLNTYIEKYNPKYSIKISTKNFGYNSEKKIKTVPLYATFLI